MVIDCNKSFEECVCGCHDFEGKDGVIAKHIVPCCFKCPYCGKNISATCHLLHERRCAKEHDAEPRGVIRSIPRQADECRCVCHRNKSMKHVMSCCIRCPHCRKRIKRTSYNSHPKRCGKGNDSRKGK